MSPNVFIDVSRMSVAFSGTSDAMCIAIGGSWYAWSRPVEPPPTDDWMWYVSFTAGRLMSFSNSPSAISRTVYSYWM